MKYYKIINNGYLVSVGTGSGGTEIPEAEYNSLLDVIHNKPTESGFDFRLKANLEWEKYELPPAPEAQEIYTEEQLTKMNNAELQAILASMGISATMNKTNMVRLILGMQAENQ